MLGVELRVYTKQYPRYQYFLPPRAPIDSQLRTLDEFRVLLQLKIVRSSSNCFKLLERFWCLTEKLQWARLKTISVIPHYLRFRFRRFSAT